MLQAMYLPPQFKGDREKAAALIQENPFASLISIDDAGLPYVTHLPLHLEEHAATGSWLCCWAMWPSPIRIGATCRRARRPW
jgi:hypothetical protein